MCPGISAAEDPTPHEVNLARPQKNKVRSYNSLTFALVQDQYDVW